MGIKLFCWFLCALCVKTCHSYDINSEGESHLLQLPRIERGLPKNSNKAGAYTLTSRNGVLSKSARDPNSRNQVTKMLRENPELSAPDECARACQEGEAPRICYYHFNLELYTTVGGACNFCTPNATNAIWPDCQCVLADGVERGILTVNRMLPGPSIQVCANDKVVIDVENHMEGIDITLHWHGILHKGTPFYDGVPYVTQCPIASGTSFRYQFIANAGTHFWHSHIGVSKLDGIYGSLIVRQPPSEDPNSHLYDFDLITHVILLSDWMHEDAMQRFPGKIINNSGQNPDNVLINGKGQYFDRETGSQTTTPLETFSVTSGNRYRFRMINSLATVCPAQLSIEGHNLTIIAVDGEPVEPVQVNTIISFSGERYDFVLEANRPIDAYWIQFRGLGVCDTNEIQQLGILRYASGPIEPSSPKPTYVEGLPQGVVMNPLDAICNVTRPDAVCVNQLRNAREINDELLVEVPDVKIFLPFKFHVLNNTKLFEPTTYNKFTVGQGGGVNLASLVDDISFKYPSSPLISQINDIDPSTFCNGDNPPTNCVDNCRCTHLIEIPLNAIVEMIFIDEVQVPDLSHPFHIHGHSWVVVGMGRSPVEPIRSINLKKVLELDRKGLLERHLKQNDHPPFKDTLAIPNNGYAILRFKADNPGFWILHCHFMFHPIIGMDFVIKVGEVEDMAPVPPNFPTCGNYLPPITLD